MKTATAGRPRASCAPHARYVEPEPEMCLYRGRTRALLRKYLELALDTGRLPSMLGREFFRARLSWRRSITFEDAVIFVHDMETAVLQLDAFSQRVLMGIIVEDYTERELARLLRTHRMTIRAHYFQSLDQLSEILLRRGLLRPLTCQEAKKPPIGVKSLQTKQI